MPNDKLYVGPRTRAAVIAVEKMVLAKDPRQSRRAVMSSAIGDFYCLPTTLGGATGSWPTQTAATQTGLDIYQDQGGTTLVKVASSQTVQNWLPAVPAASKIAKVKPNGYGQWNLDNQSCT